MRSCPRCGLLYSTGAEFCGLDGEQLVDREADPLVGRQIDRYKVIEPIGDGGMARVYRATHAFLEQDCAIKVLFGELATNREIAERFRREANAACKIKHPNVVGVLDFGTTPEGLTFMVMELVRGRTLASLIKEAGKLPPELAASVLRQVADGLHAAHSLGFVHRDLKPGNVMLIDREGGAPLAKILDFGLVRGLGAQVAPATRLTMTGQIFGTPFYMSPEQVGGGEVDARSDLYALGVILYEMLAGATPFVGALPHVLAQHLSTPAPALPPARGLETVASWLLEKEPAKRPRSAAELVTTIDSLRLAPGEPDLNRSSPNLNLPKTPSLSPGKRASLPPATPASLSAAMPATPVSPATPPPATPPPATPVSRAPFPAPAIAAPAPSHEGPRTEPSILGELSGPLDASEEAAEHAAGVSLRARVLSVWPVALLLAGGAAFFGYRSWTGPSEVKVESVALPTEPEPPPPPDRPVAPPPRSPGDSDPASKARPPSPTHPGSKTSAKTPKPPPPPKAPAGATGGPGKAPGPIAAPSARDAGAPKASPGEATPPIGEAPATPPPDAGEAPPPPAPEPPPPPDAGVSPPPPPDAGAPPAPSPTTPAPSPNDPVVLRAKLMKELVRRGLSVADLWAVADKDLRLFEQWVTKGAPSEQLLVELHEKLLTAAQSIVVDKAFLIEKLTRIDKALASHKKRRERDQKKLGERFTALEAQVAEIRKKVEETAAGEDLTLLAREAVRLEEQAAKLYSY